MQQLADRLLLSPSDVTAYLACEHLRAPSLRANAIETAPHRASRSFLVAALRSQS